jgi:hypothetical protein
VRGENKEIGTGSEKRRGEEEECRELGNRKNETRADLIKKKKKKGREKQNIPRLPRCYYYEPTLDTNIYEELLSSVSEALAP